MEAEVWDFRDEGVEREGAAVVAVSRSEAEDGDSKRDRFCSKDAREGSGECWARLLFVLGVVRLRGGDRLDRLLLRFSIKDMSVFCTGLSSFIMRSMYCLRRCMLGDWTAQSRRLLKT
jgi:hypothetical protein